MRKTENMGSRHADAVKRRDQFAELIVVAGASADGDDYLVLVDGEVGSKSNNIKNVIS